MASQREDDPRQAVEGVRLMAQALEEAAAAAGSKKLLAQADSFRAPRGFWDYRDPCRLLAQQFGAARAQTIVSEIGVLQTTLFGQAAADIAAGRCDIVAVTGAETRHRTIRALKAGLELRDTVQSPDVEPDETLRPTAEIIHPLELEHGLGLPVNQYAVVENALRYSEGLSIDEHTQILARLYAELGKIAAGNPDAWNRDAPNASVIRGAPENPMLAFPYTKLHTSQWNVDQAAGLILCSAEKARALGIPTKRWVFPTAVADSNYMLTMSERADIARCPGFRLAAQEAFAASERRPSEVTHREIYSCFPAAIRIQAREFGLENDAALSITGGMTFAGGPLNNFVLQAAAKMWSDLQDGPAGLALLTAVSGYLTKQGVSLWSNEEPAAPFSWIDVSEAAERETARVEVVTDTAASMTVSGYTVVFDPNGPARTVLLCDRDDGKRTIVSDPSPALSERAVREELCGRTVTLDAGGAIAGIS